jgi:hypothetical protein
MRTAIHHAAEEETRVPKVIADITMSLDGFVTGERADRPSRNAVHLTYERVQTNPDPGTS